jgi:hypothetical protein
MDRSGFRFYKPRRKENCAYLRACFFPQTYHIESLAKLTLAGKPAKPERPPG